MTLPTSEGTRVALHELLGRSKTIAWISAAPSPPRRALIADTEVLVLDPLDAELLRARLPHLASYERAWHGENLVLERLSRAPALPTRDEEGALAHVAFAEGELRGTLWIPRSAPRSGVRVAIGFRGRVLSSRRASLLFPCAGAISLDHLTLPADGAELEVGEETVRAISRSAVALYRKLTERHARGGLEGEDRQHATAWLQLTAQRLYEIFVREEDPPAVIERIDRIYVRDGGALFEGAAVVGELLARLRALPLFDGEAGLESLDDQAARARASALARDHLAARVSAAQRAVEPPPASTEPLGAEERPDGGSDQELVPESPDTPREHVCGDDVALDERTQVVVDSVQPPEPEVTPEDVFLGQLAMTTELALGDRMNDMVRRAHGELRFLACGGQGRAVQGERPLLLDGDHPLVRRAVEGRDHVATVMIGLEVAIEAVMRSKHGQAAAARALIERVAEHLAAGEVPPSCPPAPYESGG